MRIGMAATTIVLAAALAAPAVAHDRTRTSMHGQRYARSEIRDVQESSPGWAIPPGGRTA